jgi:hypothetical protein
MRNTTWVALHVPKEVRSSILVEVSKTYGAV